MADVVISEPFKPLEKNPYGKFKGQDLDVLEKNPEYVAWLIGRTDFQWAISLCQKKWFVEKFLEG